MPPPRSEEHKRAVRNAAARRSWQWSRSLAADAILHEAACLLGPKSRCVAYYRNGPKRPAESREAQQWAAERVVAIARARIIDTYEEAGTDSRDRRGRPELDAAIRKCQATPNAVLLIARLGLTQTSTLLFRLAESRVPFVACDKPKVNHRTVADLAAAKRLKEVRAIPDRKKAVAEAKARGVRFGSAPDVARAALKLATETWRTRAKDHAVLALVFVEEARRVGFRTNIRIAEALNARGFRTVHDYLWTGAAIANLKRWQGTERPPEILRIAAEAALRTAVEKSKAPAASPSPAVQGAPAAPLRSGVGGRPTSFDTLIKPEFLTRWAAGERHPNPTRRGGLESMSAWAEILSKWLATTHPTAHQIKRDSLRESLSALLSAAMQAVELMEKPRAVELRKT